MAPSGSGQRAAGSGQRAAGGLPRSATGDSATEIGHNPPMGSPLPELSRTEFAARLESVLRQTVAAELADRLFAHYEEMRRWNPRLSLVGPGTVKEVVERHYGESLAALPEFELPHGRLVDLGSGGGFPGWVLAAALPEWEVTLIEPNNKKRAFLFAAARRAGFSINVLDARVEAVLPEGFPDAVDRITIRALKMTPSSLTAVAERLSPAGRILLWTGDDEPAVPGGWALARSLPLPGIARRIAVLERSVATLPRGVEG